MSVIGSNILAGASGQGGGYNLTRSLRFRKSASAYLTRTPSSGGNRSIWTYSTWVKRGALSGGTAQSLLSSYGGTSDSGSFSFAFHPNDTLYVGLYSVNLFQTTAVYRDCSAYYHILLAIDTSQGTASNRAKLYVNGIQVTSFSEDARGSFGSSYQFSINTVSVAHAIGRDQQNSSRFFDGYQTETHFVDGQQLEPSSFGETSPSTGVWQPKKYAGTYGTNGFYLPFTNNASTSTLGNDFSGNGNNWTTNNISLTAGATYDSMTDVPTLTSATASNYCVLNPLDTGGTAPSSANLELINGASERGVRSTFAIPTTGLYYAEALVGTNQSGATDIAFGLVARTTNLAANPATIANGWLIYGVSNTIINRNGTTTSAGAGTALVAGDILQIAVDLANNKGWIGKNNTWFNGTTGTDGNPSTGVNPTFTFSSPPELFVLAHCYSSTINVNFGQRPFAYTPPTGFVALNTFNLPTPTIGATASTQANKYMDATTYTGNGTTLAVTNSGSFQPDFVWVKRRNGASDHYLSNSIGGANKNLYSNRTTAEVTDNSGGYLSSFNSNGFTAITGSTNAQETNSSGDTYVGWQWKANGTGVTNTAGSITSTVSANTSSGFSVVTYTGTGANATVGHGLGVAPSMIICKTRNITQNWIVYHSTLGKNQLVYLNSTDSAITNSDYWGTGGVTSTVFGLKGGGFSHNLSSEPYVAYCFSAVAGYSAFGSYTGNGSTDGPFVYLGFRPRYLMIKSTAGSERWLVYDSARDPFNAISNDLVPNTSAAEAGAGGSVIDLLSNGFKIRSTASSAFNFNGYGYIYMAFAENPTKYSLAR